MPDRATPRLPRGFGAFLCLCILAIASPFTRAATTSTQLALPSQGRPGFTRVPSSTSGLAFTNTLSPLAAAANQNLMNGSGVAAGDIDGDGRCDLYFCNVSGTNALFRNLGDWRFENITTAAGVSFPNRTSSGAVFADLEGDGDLDLLVSTLGTGVHAFRNDGQGRFKEVTAEAGLTANTGSTSLALADIDGDGDLDLYVANYGAFSVLRSGGRAEVKMINGQWVVQGPHAHRLRYVDGRMEEVGEVGVLYLNNGKGQFTPVPWNSPRFLDTTGKPKPPPPDYGLSVQMRDVNGDGAPDIYVCNDFQTLDRLWINDGTGNFREASFLALRKFPFSSMGVDFADLDRDGELDFMAVEMAGSTHARRMNQVTGIDFLPNVPGRFDYRPEVNRNTLYRSNGDNSWSEVAEFAGVSATDWSWQPVFLDVDLDGFEDLLVVNGMMYDTQDRDTLARIRALGKQTAEAARTNLLAYPAYPSPKSAFRNRGNFTFEDRAKEWGLDALSIAQGIALADLDNDGDMDLAINNLNDGAMLFRNEGTEPRIQVRLTGRAPNTRGIGARIRVLGGPMAQSQEIIAGGRYLSGDDAMRTFATGTASRLTIEVTWRSGLQTVVSNALPNHQYALAEVDAQPTRTPPKVQPRPLFTGLTARLRHVHKEELYDDFARQPLLPKQLSSLGPGIAWFDLDGDDQDELVIGTGRGGPIQACRFTPNGEIQWLSSDWKAPDDVSGFTAWVQPDGKPVLMAAVAKYETAQTGASSLFSITTAPGSTNLMITPLQGIATPPSSLGPLAAADINGDGQLDVFMGGRLNAGNYPRPARSRLHLGGTTSPNSGANVNALFQSIGMVSGAIWSDLKGDGFPDLVLACEWGPIRIYRNRKGTLEPWDPPVIGRESKEKAAKLSSLSGWWNSVETGDFDGDGRMDIVAGNWGLNTGYIASKERPLRLYFGDFSGGGGTDLIEAYYPRELATEMPRRSLNALGQAMPALAERFPTHAAFSTATLPDLITVLPSKPEVLMATTLASTLFLNREDHFIAIELPSPAQFSPVFGIVTADIDGDGNEDVFLAQNFFATRPEWPRNDAGRGLWLRGDGRGGFKPLTAAESGVRIYGEQRGAAIGDFDRDGRPDLAVPQNGGPTTLWRNTAGTPGLRVRLRGPSGNTQAWGSVVRLRFGDQFGPAREFHSGHGYWSQDSAWQILAKPRPATEVEIRWPGGKMTSHPVPPNAREIVIHSDGPIESR